MVTLFCGHGWPDRFAVLWDVERSLYSVVTADLTILLCYGMLSGHSILWSRLA